MYNIAIYDKALVLLHTRHIEYRMRAQNKPGNFAGKGLKIQAAKNELVNRTSVLPTKETPKIPKHEGFQLLRLIFCLGSNYSGSFLGQGSNSSDIFL